MSFTTFMVRRIFKKGDDKRDAGLTTPADIERWDDICFGTDRKWQMMDVYRPKGSDHPLPVIVSIHGGGWTYGDKERYQYYCMNLAQRGFAVVNFTYRPAPEFKFPAGIEDTNLVFAWVLKNERNWFDLSRIYAVGDSAGGHMLTIYSAACANSSYASKLGITVPKKADGSTFLPDAVGLNCGVYEIDLGPKANGMTKGLIKALLKKKGAPEEIDLLNPLPYIPDRFPRAFIMTAFADPLAGPPAQAGLVKKLTEIGSEFVDKTYGSQDNPLSHVFHCNIKTEDARICNDDECNYFLNGHL